MNADQPSKWTPEAKRTVTAITLGMALYSMGFG